MLQDVINCLHGRALGGHTVTRSALSCRASVKQPGLGAHTFCFILCVCVVGLGVGVGAGRVEPGELPRPSSPSASVLSAVRTAPVPSTAQDCPWSSVTMGLGVGSGATYWLSNFPREG